MSIEVHRGHCCILHGCEYGDKDCPVVNRQEFQDYPCDFCIDNVYDLISAEFKKPLED